MAVVRGDVLLLLVLLALTLPRAAALMPTGVLFICLGNICRSPTAEAVFRQKVEQAGLASAFNIDSCGTGGGNPNWYEEGGFSYHEGDNADSRMSAAALRRKISLTSKSRPLSAKDVETFDHLVCMDSKNQKAVLEAAKYWGLGDVAEGKVKMMMDYSNSSNLEYVPDPYYGGSDGFEKVLDLLDDASQGLLESLMQSK
jgi:protein-tyrosine phosphatase